MGEGPLECRFCGGFSQGCPDPRTGRPCCERCLEVGDGHEYDTSSELPPISGAPTTIEGMTLYGPGGLVAAFRRNEEGEIVEVDPEDALIGVAIDSDLRTRWMTVRDAPDDDD